MEEIIKIQISPAFEGTTTILLEREIGQDGRVMYYITHDQSQYTGYRSGPDIRKFEIPSNVVEDILKELESTQIGICPDETMGLDGKTTQIEIERGFNKVLFKWWQGLPRQWKNLAKVFDLLEQPPKLSPVTTQPVKTKLDGNPDSTCICHNSEDKIQESNDEVCEDLWPVDEDTVKLGYGKGSRPRKQALLKLGEQAADVLHCFVLLQNSIRTWRVILFEYVDYDEHEKKVHEISEEFNRLVHQLEVIASQPPTGRIETDVINALGQYLCDVVNAVSAYAHQASLINVYQRGHRIRGAIAVWKAGSEIKRRVEEYQKSGFALKLLWPILQNL